MSEHTSTTNEAPEAPTLAEFNAYTPDQRLQILASLLGMTPGGGSTTAPAPAVVHAGLAGHQPHTFSSTNQPNRPPAVGRPPAPPKKAGSTMGFANPSSDPSPARTTGGGSKLALGGIINKITVICLTDEAIVNKFTGESKKAHHLEMLKEAADELGLLAYPRINYGHNPEDITQILGDCFSRIPAVQSAIHLGNYKYVKPAPITGDLCVRDRKDEHGVAFAATFADQKYVLLLVTGAEIDALPNSDQLLAKWLDLIQRYEKHERDLANPLKAPICQWCNKTTQHDIGNCMVQHFVLQARNQQRAKQRLADKVSMQKGLDAEKRRLGIKSPKRGGKKKTRTTTEAPSLRATEEPALSIEARAEELMEEWHQHQEAQLEALRSSAAASERAFELTDDSDVEADSETTPRVAVAAMSPSTPAGRLSSVRPSTTPGLLSPLAVRAGAKGKRGKGNIRGRGTSTHTRTLRRRSGVLAVFPKQYASTGPRTTKTSRAAAA